MLATGVTAALVATGGVISVVSWTTGSALETFTVRAARIPKMAPPSVQLRSRPRITWMPVAIAEDVAVHRYVVTRHLGTVHQVACDVPAGRRLQCIDIFAPAGYEATYTVVATHGAHWTGPDSEPSAPVTAPGEAVPISVNGVMVVPGARGAAVVTGAAPSADPSADPPGGSPEGPEPAADPGATPDVPPVDVDTEPVVIPPAPPESATEDPIDEVEPATEPSSTPTTESMDTARTADRPAGPASVEATD
jgi:hypothetical protein